jgi:hypothetical protein
MSLKGIEKKPHIITDDNAARKYFVLPCVKLSFVSSY